MRRCAALVVPALAAMLAPAAGQVPAGGEFRVNVVTTGDQSSPAVAALPDGGFVVLWSSPGGSVQGQHLDPTGLPRGSQFQVSGTTATGVAASVAADEKGRFVVAWSAYLSYTDGEIRARRYDASGTPQGPEFAVNTPAPGLRSRPAVAMARGGGFVVDCFDQRVSDFW